VVAAETFVAVLLALLARDGLRSLRVWWAVRQAKARGVDPFAYQLPEETDEQRAKREAAEAETIQRTAKLQVRAMLDAQREIERERWGRPCDES